MQTVTEQTRRARVVHRQPNLDSEGRDIVRVFCPYCAEEHQHGVDRTLPAGGDGTYGRRWSDCYAPGGQYLVVHEHDQTAPRPPAPPTQVLYRYWAGSVLLYVGVTDDAHRRMRQHVRGAAWWPDATSVTFERYATRDEVLTAERVAIRAEKPLHNEVGR